MTERRALVAEDSLLILMSLEMLLEHQDVTIVGPASTVAEALALARAAEFDIAILDVNLHNELIFPVADALRELGIPFIFTTGYEPAGMIAPRFADVPSIQKPYQSAALMKLVEHAFTLASAHKDKTA
jgi:CheY-like chemotaxis protein